VSIKQPRQLTTVELSQVINRLVLEGRQKGGKGRERKGGGREEV